ncbi:hypothetical protein [Eikenella sp. NML96-A-049]|uniref:hypothetical protein n=1 Tax=Eikenella sp. NML96-A-049 TaxID=1809061 RepID=UPI000F6391D4|nr:hypothetical protein [Eikenella sp. NML96-A-049]
MKLKQQMMRQGKASVASRSLPCLLYRRRPALPHRLQIALPLLRPLCRQIESSVGLPYVFRQRSVLAKGYLKSAKQKLSLHFSGSLFQ